MTLLADLPVEVDDRGRVVIVLPDYWRFVKRVRATLEELKGDDLAACEASRRPPKTE